MPVITKQHSVRRKKKHNIEECNHNVCFVKCPSPGPALKQTPLEIRPTISCPYYWTCVAFKIKSTDWESAAAVVTKSVWVCAADCVLVNLLFDHVAHSLSLLAGTYWNTKMTAASSVYPKTSERKTRTTKSKIIAVVSKVKGWSHCTWRAFCAYFWFKLYASDCW